jgi:hypothetical protein
MPRIGPCGTRGDMVHLLIMGEPRSMSVMAIFRQPWAGKRFHDAFVAYTPETLEER